MIPSFVDSQQHTAQVGSLAFPLTPTPGSLCSPGWPRDSYADQANFKLRDLSIFASSWTLNFSTD